MKQIHTDSRCSSTTKREEVMVAILVYCLILDRNAKHRLDLRLGALRSSKPPSPGPSPNSLRSSHPFLLFLSSPFSPSPVLLSPTHSSTPLTPLFSPSPGLHLRTPLSSQAWTLQFISAGWLLGRRVVRGKRGAVALPAPVSISSVTPPPPHSCAKRCGRDGNSSESGTESQ